MTTNYNTDWNKRGVNGFGSQFSDTVYSATLKAATDTTVAVPLTAAVGAPTAASFNKFLAIIACTPSDDVFMALNQAAVVPAGVNFAAASAELIPNGYIAKMVKSTDVLHFISASTPSVSVSFYAIQE